MPLKRQCSPGLFPFLLLICQEASSIALPCTHYLTESPRVTGPADHGLRLPNHAKLNLFSLHLDSLK